MTTPEQNEPQMLNEPEHLEAEGYLVRAWRRLSKGLGLFLTKETGNSWWSEENRDLTPILREMNRHWEKLSLDNSDESWVKSLRDFRNESWAHQGEYSDREVLQRIYVIGKLLRAVSAEEQAREVAQMYEELGRLIFSQATPESPRDIENAELRQRISELEKEKSEISAQFEGFRSAASLMGLAQARVAPIVSPIVPTTNDGVLSDARPIAPDSAEDFLRRGNEARRDGYIIEDALDNYSQAIELNPNLVEAYVGLGNTYMDGEEYESAIAGYREALRLDPNDAVIYFYRGLAYAALGDHDRAISDYSDALGHNPADNLAMAAYGNRGNAYRIQEEYDRAIADYDAALNLNPNDEVAAGLYFSRGNAYRGQGEYDSAIADCTEALQLDPEMVEAYDVRGFAYSCQGEYDIAIADCEMALQLDPENKLAYSTRGYAYFLIGEYDLAIADWENMLSLELDDGLAELAREGMRLAQNSKNRAVLTQEKAELDRYIEENQRDPHGWYSRGVYYLEREDYSSAVVEFTIAIKYAELGTAPEDGEVWNDRGWAHWKQGQDNLAYDDYSKAIELKPDFANAYYNRAWVWRRRGDHGNAIIDFSQAITLKPDYAAAYQHRGISYFDIGERDKAQADFEMARSLGYQP